MTLPMPVSLDPSGIFLGNDGNWSTWSAWVGTPPQQFNIIPSTSSGEVWVPDPQGCQSRDCATSRGVEGAEGENILGFQNNISSTWDQIGIYELLSGSDLFQTEENGLYGLDTVSIGNKDMRISTQVVAGIATSDFWLGTFGLTRSASDFPVRSETIAGLVDTMKAQNMTPSMSFSLSVGAHYDSFPGSLVIGGYDQSMFDEDGVEIPVASNRSRPLVASVQSIVATNTLNGTISYTHELSSTPMAIDSAVSQLWLPATVCEQLSASLNLTYDNSTGLYLVSKEARDRLSELSPEFTVTLAADTKSNQTASIVLPYAAFDQKIGLPFFNEITNYFPIRQAVNDSMYILGRAFLQEAYLVVDWERGNFTIGQGRHESSSTRNLIPILPFVEESLGRSSLSPGVIAGVAIAAAASAVGIAVLLYFLWWKRRDHAAEKQTGAPSTDYSYVDEKKVGEYGNVDTKVALLPEAGSAPLHELHDDQLRYQLMSNPVYELPAERVGQELEASPKRRSTRSS